MRKRIAASLFLLLTVCARPSPTLAVITYQQGGAAAYDASYNTSAPAGELAASGWQYEGRFGGFLGTPIAAKYFITASHIGLAATSLVYQGTSYGLAFDPVTNQPISYRDPGSDLIIYQIAGEFPSYAPLWTNAGSEAGKKVVVFGCGTERGDDVLVGSDQHLGGWLWGADTRVQRWGTNTVTDIVSGDASQGNFLHSTFDAGAGPDEATLSTGDSGGGAFVQDTDGRWKLAGVHFGVDGPFYDPNAANPNSGFLAALFDSTGFEEIDNGAYVPASNPSAMYSTEIAARLPFIELVLRTRQLAKLGNDVVFSFLAESGKTYRVERTDALGSNTQWTSLADNLTGDNVTILVTDSGAAALSQRFYRVVVEQP